MGRGRWGCMGQEDRRCERGAWPAATILDQGLSGTGERLRGCKTGSSSIMMES